MKTKASSLGSIHPVIFFAVVYVVALLLSIFICSSLFHAFNGSTHASAPVLPAERTMSTGQNLVAATAVNLQQ